MVIAFDFDHTITDIRLQRLAKKMIRERNEVWIVTMRKENDFNKKIVKPVLDKIGLPEMRVIYCDEKPKRDFLAGINADVYVDNISTEFSQIINHTNTVPLLFSGY